MACKKAILCMLLLFPMTVYAGVDHTGLLQSITDKFFHSALAWRGIIINAASWLFWTLGTISLTWTMGMLALKRADISEFFSEFIRFIMFFGFFLWLLRNGPDFAVSIIESLIKIGAEASGNDITNPSDIIDVGIDIFKRTLDHTTLWQPITSIIGFLLCFIIFLTLALVAANMVVQLCAAWILLYAGIFFLGFGGSQWTSDMAINYYKAVLGIAASLMTTILIIGVATSLINDYHSQMEQGIEFMEMGSILIVSVILLSLINKVPPMVAGIVSGFNPASSGIGQFTVGSAVGAATVAAAAISAGRDALTAGAQNIVGGAQAVHAAYQQAQDHRAQSAGLFNTDTQSTAPSQGFAAAMNRGMTMMADMAKNLAQGAGDVAQSHVAATKQDFQGGVAETLGGQIAAAIQERGLSEQSDSSSAFDNDSLSGGSDNNAGEGGETHAEVKNFMDKGSASGGQL